MGSDTDEAKEGRRQREAKALRLAAFIRGEGRRPRANQGWAAMEEWWLACAIRRYLRRDLTAAERRLLAQFRETE